ncbi:MAG TPA: hypothetical protein VLA13_01780 [Massilibacterium sp.]|nr:hypothetical protein [Massilibacterium sp.]
MSDDKFIYGKNINTGENYGHIGDRYEGIKQRIFTEEDFESLRSQIDDFKSKYSEKINDDHITIGNPGDKESTIYSQQIYNALTQNGFDVEIMTLQTFGYIDKDFSVSNAPDDTVLVEVFQAPNV